MSLISGTIPTQFGSLPNLQHL